MPTKNTIGPRFLLALLAVASPFPVSAHHSFATYDGEKTVTVEGAVKAFKWVNPHARIEMLVRGDDGAVAEWSIEMGPPQHLVLGGWKRHMLKPGDTISVTLHPRKDGAPGGSYITAKNADGVRIVDAKRK